MGSHVYRRPCAESPLLPLFFYGTCHLDGLLVIVACYSPSRAFYCRAAPNAPHSRLTSVKTSPAHTSSCRLTLHSACGRQRQLDDRSDSNPSHARSASQGQRALIQRSSTRRLVMGSRCASRSGGVSSRRASAAAPSRRPGSGGYSLQSTPQLSQPALMRTPSTTVAVSHDDESHRSERRPLITSFFLQSPKSFPKSKVASMYVLGTFWMYTSESDQDVEAWRWRPTSTMTAVKVQKASSPPSTSSFFFLQNRNRIPNSKDDLDDGVSVKTLPQVGGQCVPPPPPPTRMSSTSTA